jgi:aminopeptidase N
VTVHAKEIWLKEASFKNNDTGVGPSVLEIRYHLVDTTVTLIFDSDLPLGRGQLCFKFEGILNTDMAGFYRSNYTDADGKKQVMASTQFEALDARRAFPCWDEPAVKATFSVALIVPKELTAISNMPELSTTFLPGGKKRVDFDISPKMSTYLVAWAIGHFDFVQTKTTHGVTIRVFSPPGIPIVVINDRRDYHKFIRISYRLFFPLPPPILSRKGAARHVCIGCRQEIT